jgi:hypothetical protein
MYTQNTLLPGSARNEMGSKKSSAEKMSVSQAVLYFKDQRPWQTWSSTKWPVRNDLALVRNISDNYLSERRLT